MTQSERLLDYLQHSAINPLEAWSQLGIYRLAARVNDLKKAGHTIETRKITVTNSYFEACRVAEYRLAEKQMQLRMEA